MENSNQTHKQLLQINDFMKNFGRFSYTLSSSNEIVQDSISIPLGNGYQAATVLSRIEQLQPGTIFHPEDIANTFDYQKHKYLILNKTKPYEHEI